MLLKNYITEYTNLVTFLPNKTKKIHRWYSLVEGFSFELVEKIINEQKKLPKLCLDPFGGVGTTALTAQSLGVEYISIEASPFFFDVALAKLESKQLKSVDLIAILSKIELALRRKNKDSVHPDLESKTFFEKNERKKWIFHHSVSNGIFDVLSEIEKYCTGEMLKYKPVLKISLATILQEVSNVFKNGKCLSYKKNWREKIFLREQVHTLFIKHAESIILSDIINNETDLELSYNPVVGSVVFGDSRVAVKSIEKKVDLVITSPPYLNSRDYTDIYRMELWMLGYIKTYDNERLLRFKALTSHVQIPLPKVDYPKVPALEKAIEYLEAPTTKLWNKNIPNMVRGYFNDMQNLLNDLKPKLSNGAMLYINVSNSCYANHIIEVDYIIASASELIGYRCVEIRIARFIKTSSQQKNINTDNKMRESIIVLEFLGD